MIRTCCAACGTQLANTAPRCGNCSTPYCGRGCQKLHWKAGHKKECKQIELGGGAEQYYADKKCAEAVAVAVEECADDTQGQTCYICTEALHWKTKEGLVRMCACRGTAGFAHVSCLAEQAKIVFAEAAERNLDDKAAKAWTRWHTCRQCEQNYHGVVRCALGWACWKTYVGRPQTDVIRRSAMAQLGNGLFHARHYEDALSVQEADLAMERRLGAPEEDLLIVQSNLANSYDALGRLEALNIYRDVYSGRLKFQGEEDELTLIAANNYASSLGDLQRFEEAKSLLRETVPVARRVLGQNHERVLRMRLCYAYVLYDDPTATLDDLREAVTTLGKTGETARRVLGGAHPLVAQIEGKLRDARAALRAREEPSPGAP